jgi:hypothetical protein
MYNTKQIAEILKVSDKTVRRYLNSYFTINNGAYEVSEKMLDVLKNDYIENPDIVVQEFTSGEYLEFHKRLSEYPVLMDRITDILKDLEYHRKSAESHNLQMELILRNLEQRNYIEAKDKKLDNAPNC